MTVRPGLIAAVRMLVQSQPNPTVLTGPVVAEILGVHPRRIPVVLDYLREQGELHAGPRVRVRGRAGRPYVGYCREPWVGPDVLAVRDLHDSILR